MTKLYTTFIILLCCYALPCTAQFVVKKGTVVTVNSKITTTETKNRLDASIKGSGELVFNSKAHTYQNITTLPTVSLPSVVYTNATQIIINTPLNITGNLTLRKGELVVPHTLAVSGELIQLHPNTSIIGTSNILNHAIAISNGLATTTHLKTVAKKQVLPYNCIEQGFAAAENFTKQPIVSHTTQLITQYITEPNSPPPKLGQV